MFIKLACSDGLIPVQKCKTMEGGLSLGGSNPSSKLNRICTRIRNIKPVIEILRRHAVRHIQRGKKTTESMTGTTVFRKRPAPAVFVVDF